MVRAGREAAGRPHQVGAFDVSTVFLGVGYGNPPFLFETVVLESYRVREVWRRYVSWGEARPATPTPSITL